MSRTSRPPPPTRAHLPAPSSQQPLPLRLPSGRALWSCASLLGLGCAAGDTVTDPGTAVDGVVDTTSPVVVRTPGALPPLGLHGRAPLLTAEGATTALGGEYADGRDLAVGPREATVDDIVDAAASDRFASTAAFRRHLSDALRAAEGDRAAVDIGAATRLADLLRYLFGAHSRTDPVDVHTVSFPVERARWLTGQFVSNPRNPLRPAWQEYRAPALDELRERGARLYCAVRELQRDQGTEPLQMGSQAAFSFEVFGRRVRFLVVEPSVSLGGPRRFINNRSGLAPGVGPDGAQAFEVPLLFGTRVTPVEGVGLPSLGDVRYPLVLSTGESEVATRAELRRVLTGPRPSLEYTKEYQTVTHADAVSWGHQGIHGGGSVALFTAGLLTVFVDFGVDFEAGTLEVRDDRVLHTDPVAWPGWPTARRSGRLWNGASIGYHEGAWDDRPSCSEFNIPRCPTWDWAVLPEGDFSDANNPFYQLTAAQAGPIDTRVRQDNDHALEIGAEVRLHGGLRAVAGIPRLGPFELNVTGTAELTAGARQSQLVRDAAFAERVPGQTLATPTAGLAVRPRTLLTQSFEGINVDFHFHMDLFIGSIDWTAHLFSTDPIRLATWDSESTRAWPESSSLRIGTGSARGDTLLRPEVHSHLPGRPDVASFPMSVPECLADRRPNASTPVPCLPRPPDGAAPSANLCLYEDLTQRLANPDDAARVCANPELVAGDPGLSSPQAQCLRDWVGYLCQPTSLLEGRTLSHVIDPASPEAAYRLRDIQNECARAFVTLSGNPTADRAAVQDFVNGWFRVGVCDWRGHMLPPAEVLVAGDDPLRGPAVEAPADCR